MSSGSLAAKVIVPLFALSKLTETASINGIAVSSKILSASVSTDVVKPLSSV